MQGRARTSPRGRPTRSWKPTCRCPGGAAYCDGRVYSRRGSRAAAPSCSCPASTPRASTSRGWSASRGTIAAHGPPGAHRRADGPGALPITTRTTDMIEDAALVASTQRTTAATAGSACSGSASAAGSRSSRPDGRALRDRVAFVMAFGGHADLPRTLRVSVHRRPARRRASVRRTTTASRSSCSAPRIGSCRPTRSSRCATRSSSYLEASRLDMVDKAKARVEFQRAKALEAALASRRGPTWTTSTRATSRIWAGAAAPRRGSRRRSRAVARAAAVPPRRSTCCTARTTTSSRQSSPRSSAATCRRAACPSTCC